MKKALTFAFAAVCTVVCSSQLFAQKPNPSVLRAAAEGPDQQACSKVQQRRRSADTATIELAKAFLDDRAYFDSSCRFGVYTILVEAYVQAKNWTMALDAIDHADAFFPNVPVEQKRDLYNRGRMI